MTQVYHDGQAKELFAWRVTHPQFPDMDLFYAAETKGKAKYMAQKAAIEAGYTLTYFSFRARRASYYDHRVIGPGNMGWRDNTWHFGVCADDEQSVWIAPHRLQRVKSQ